MLEKNLSASHTKLRNSEGCSVFRSELIAIDTGLKKALSIQGSNGIWILSDSRSAIQHLSNWQKVGDNTGVAILEKLKLISSSREIHYTMGTFATLPSREMRLMTPLAKYGVAQPTMNSVPLTYSELHPTYISNKQSTVLPAHHWYEAK
ncbi:RNase H domain-containing protein [Trichonephila clavipes]|nr:RNase H domain-containing protein [Trichonephila clavipes]